MRTTRRRLGAVALATCCAGALAIFGTGPAAAVSPAPLDLCIGTTAIRGGTGDDVLTGTDGPDVICGYGGNDTIQGLGGNDIIFGGDGNDTIYGGDGVDTIHGDANADIIFGGPLDDWLYGDDGIDAIFSGEGNDYVFGGDGNDFMDTGTSSGDTFDGGPGTADTVAMLDYAGGTNVEYWIDLTGASGAGPHPKPPGGWYGK